MAQRPRLLASPLTGEVYVVTKYEERGDGKFTAITKYPVTDDFNALVATVRAGESPAPLCATCGHDEDEHHTDDAQSGREGDLWCESCGSFSGSHPFAPSPGSTEEEKP